MDFKKVCTRCGKCEDDWGVMALSFEGMDFSLCDFCFVKVLRFWVKEMDK